MLEEFYRFIAQTIVSYFMNLEQSGMMQNAESFSLKLDDEEMVQGVDRAIREELKNQNIGRVTEIKCLQGETYDALTAALSSEKEIIIASQIDGMTNDFLCATLRNSAKELNKSILMISSSLIDSAVSGSRDMSVLGMPFYYENLMIKIKELVDCSSQLTNVEKKIVEFEMDRRNSDAFSDRDSFYEYADLLSVVTSGKIDKSQYKNFRLFPINSKIEYSTLNDKQIESVLMNNNSLFEKFSTAIKFSTVEKDFSKDFEQSFINKLEEAIKDDPDDWSNKFLYSDLLEQKNKKAKKTDNPLVIESSDIEIHDNVGAFSLSPECDYVIRKDGKQTGKKRKQSIIIFNSALADKVYIEFTCRANVKASDVSSKVNANNTKTNKVFTFEYEVKDTLYDLIKIEDSSNGIKYEFSICILNFSNQYLFETIRYKSLVDSNKKLIKLSDVNSDVIFNENASNEVSEALAPGGTYKCSLDEKLILRIDGREILDYEDGMLIDVNFGGIKVMFKLFPDESGVEEITGKKLMRDKYSNKQSFTYTGNLHMHRDSFEYFAKGNLLRELKLEKQLVNEKIIFGAIRNLNATEELLVEQRKLDINDKVKEAYLNFLDTMIKKKTLPSLMYLKGELLEIAQVYINTFMEYLDNLINDAPLTEEQRNTVLIGSVVVGKFEEVWLSPLHPLNVAYQLSLLDEKGFEYANDIIIDRLSSTNLFPYLKIEDKNYKVSDQSSSLEWNYYAPVENKKYRGSRKFIPRLVEDKIEEYVSHFKYLFDEINNYHLKINVINMGDCSEVFQGIAQYYMHYVNRNPNYENLLNIEVNVYGDFSATNKFLALKNFDDLKETLSEMNLAISRGITMSTLEGILSKSVSCYFCDDSEVHYDYAHISFYEMESNIMSGFSAMDDMETGASLGGIVSGIPSSKYGSDYRTGFGTKYSESSPLINVAKKINSVAQVGGTSNPYNDRFSISTQVNKASIDKMEYIYKTSNWVVFVEPKVDLSFFTEKETKGELLIIHYSDQYTTSSGYDAITITHKSNQYVKVIEEQLTDKGIDCSTKDAASLINIFNSINGDWLLRLVSSISGKKSGTFFDREKISIAAGIKLMLAYLKNKDILWIPVSLEEMLRVSGGAALSSKNGVLSAKNLGFEDGATSDDLLFVGMNFSGQRPVVYLYPVEVKTGNNTSTVIDKAINQVKATAKGLSDSFAIKDESLMLITQKIQRNFLIQLLINSCKKMKIYHIDDSSNWELVLDKFRTELLNDNFEISFDINEFLGNAAVLSFKKTSQERQTSFREGAINILEFRESDEYGLILKTVSEIASDLEESKSDTFKLLNDIDVNSLTGDMSKVIKQVVVEPSNESETIIDEDNPENEDSFDDSKQADVNVQEPEENFEIKNSEGCGMKIELGTNQQSGKSVIWEPNDTDVLFHTNTGIIGTMGTGKTQFTKSLITQLYLNRNNNIGDEELGILIFDYKGDYNENKEDFVKATNAKILKPYHLPINPFAIVKPKAYKPLLPMHIANTFRDTLCKIYNLGPKQQSTIVSCIKEAYLRKGIVYQNPDTWDNTPPSFNDVYHIYDEDEEIKKGDSLSSILYDLYNFELFEPNSLKAQSLFDLLHGVVVVDLNGYDSKIQNLIVAITLDLFYSNMQAEGSSILEGKYRQMKKIILVDEADNFMRENFPSLKKIMKEGREYGIGVVLSTQFLKHFMTSEDDYSRYILTWVVHNVADLKKSEIDYIFKTSNNSEDTSKLFNDIGKLEKHYSIVKIGNEPLAYMQDKAFWQLYKELFKD